MTPEFVWRGLRTIFASGSSVLREARCSVLFSRWSPHVLRWLPPIALTACVVGIFLVSPRETDRLLTDGDRGADLAGRQGSGVDRGESRVERVVPRSRGGGQISRRRDPQPAVLRDAEMMKSFLVLK